MEEAEQKWRKVEEDYRMFERKDGENNNSNDVAITATKIIIT